MATNFSFNAEFNMISEFLYMFYLLKRLKRHGIQKFHERSSFKDNGFFFITVILMMARKDVIKVRTSGNKKAQNVIHIHVATESSR